jgi:pyrimidine-specific ribonucleoside hydrolase
MQDTDTVRRPVIIDTDMSFDDYVALLYLLQHPAIDVRALTVVNGVVHVKPGVVNARRLLALVDRKDIPVAGGPDRPTTGDHEFSGSWRTIFDYGPRFLLPWSSAAPTGLSAPELIRRQCLASETPVTFVALGPLTNLALALRADASLADRIDTIYVSGGAFDVPGPIHDNIPANPNTVSEWNFYVDPEAADLVFKAGIRIALVPLDVTHVTGPQPLLFNREFVRRLRGAVRGRGARLMVRLIYWWQLTVPEYPATPVWDAAVAAIVADPAVGSEWRDAAIRVVTQPDEVSGQTVIEPEKPANARVCFKGDRAAFEAAYLAAAQR